MKNNYFNIVVHFLTLSKIILILCFHQLLIFPKYSFEASGVGFMVGDSGCQLAGQTRTRNAQNNKNH